MNLAEYLLGERALASRGAKVALICGGEYVTYTELARRMHAAAAALRALGVRPGDRVVLMMRETPDCAAAWLGAVHAGAAAVPLNPRLAAIDCRHVVSDSGARLVLIDESFVDAHAQFVAELAATGRLAIAGRPRGNLPSWNERTSAAAAGAPRAAIESEQAFCLYSSGTTGRPKGIAFAHDAVLSVGRAFQALEIGAGDSVFSTSKFFFAYGLEHSLLAPLAAGIPSILCPGWPEVEVVASLVERHAPTAMFSVPTVYRRLLAEAPSRLAPFRSLRRFVAAGERLSPQLVGQWREATGGELLNLYGMSETFCACLVTPCGTSDGERSGMALPGTEVRLRDDQGNEPPAASPGVLWVRHPAMTRGYLNLPAQTQAQFRDGWFRSGDIFVRDAAGFFAHQGRADDLLKVAGQWVWPTELEQAAARSPAVADAACVPVLDRDGLQRLALFVTAAADATDAERGAAAACEGSLPPHKRPKWVRVVAELPRTASGKLQRFRLREILERELAGKE